MNCEKGEEKVVINRSGSRVVEEGEDNRESDYSLPVSKYVRCLPSKVESVSEHKMLKYWEKHVIPKLMDYTRSSFKAYEFEEFFEQIRIPLRKGEQERAAEVAYTICENRLPQGVILPDQNYDWASIPLEEIQVGDYLLCKLTTHHNHPHHPFFNTFVNKNVHSL